MPVIKALAKEVLKTMEKIQNTEVKRKKINLKKIKEESISKARANLSFDF